MIHHKKLPKQSSFRKIENFGLLKDTSHNNKPGTVVFEQKMPVDHPVTVTVWAMSIINRKQEADLNLSNEKEKLQQ